MKNPVPLLFWLLVLGGVLSYVVTTFQKSAENKQQIESAFAQYQKGEKAPTIGEREDSFNQALEDYSRLEKEHKPNLGNGKLFYNIGNSYFNLGQYPFAVLYYYKALSLMPREQKVSSNLQAALGKLGVHEEKEIPLFKLPLSIPERLQVFFGCSVLAFFLSSFYIWFGYFKKLSIFFALLAIGLLINLGYHHYLTPVEGVLVKSAPLFRDSGFQYSKVKEAPILSGTKVDVLDILDEGRWIKIETPADEVGYIPSEYLRII